MTTIHTQEAPEPTPPSLADQRKAAYRRLQVARQSMDRAADEAVAAAEQYADLCFLTGQLKALNNEEPD
jgi:hypothetical protein